jgi:hypothetical protein
MTQTLYAHMNKRKKIVCKKKKERKKIAEGDGVAGSYKLRHIT